jgi:hypothetical protein
MKILRSKYVIPVVAAIILVGAAIVLDLLKRTGLYFSHRETEIVNSLCYVVGFPFLPLMWAGLTPPKSHVASVLLGVLLLILWVGIWASIIYFMRALFVNIRGMKK